jgi:hypothetical protein
MASCARAEAPVDKADAAASSAAPNTRTMPADGTAETRVDPIGRRQDGFAAR